MIVQATCHGADNRAMVDAVRSAADGRARGVATVRPDVTDAELRELDEAGVRGVRFNFVKRLVDAAPKDELAAIAERIAPLGWHVVIYFEAADLPDLEDFFGALPTPLVVDHMGRPDVTKPVDGPEFGRFLRFVERNDVWVKVSCPERLSVTGPPRRRRRAERLHRRRALRPAGRSRSSRTGCCGAPTGPTPTSPTTCPTTGCWSTTCRTSPSPPTSSQKLLVDNPMRLYWPDEDLTSLDRSTSATKEPADMQHPNAANRLDRLPICRFHKIDAGRAVAFAYFFEFADINSFAVTAPKLVKLWGLTVNQIAYVTSLSFVGMFFGSLVGRGIADRWGRKNGPDRHHALLQRSSRCLGVLPGHRPARRLPGADLGRAVGDDRGRGHLPQRDVPGRRPRQVPGVRHRDRHLRHPGHQPDRQR